MSSTNGCSYPERDVRQRDLVPPQRLALCHAVVVGVGAIGRQVALQLAAVGVPRLTLIDHDAVGEENLAPQGYWPEDLGQPKAVVTAALCRRVNPEAHIFPVAERFKRSAVGDYVAGDRLVAFACVDSIETRRLLWEALRHRAALYLDGRMSAEVVRVLAVDAPATDGSYATTLFPAAEAHTGPCTAKSTLYAASIAAGLLVGQFARWLRGLPVDSDLTLNLLASELTAGRPQRR
jgi:molybdopterin-synthase adenylyltransferase